MDNFDDVPSPDTPVDQLFPSLNSEGDSQSAFDLSSFSPPATDESDIHLYQEEPVSDGSSTSSDFLGSSASSEFVPSSSNQEQETYNAYNGDFGALRSVVPDSAAVSVAAASFIESISPPFLPLLPFPPSSNPLILLFVRRKYNQQHEKFIQEKQTRSQERHQEILDQAKEEVKRFHEERRQHLEQVKEENRIKNEGLKDVPPSSHKEAWVNLKTLIDFKETDAQRERIRKGLSMMASKA